MLVGAGMGLCIAPLTSVVLSGPGPARAGGVSGALGSVQQVGSSVGVALTGVIFFGTLGRGYNHAFGLCAAALAGLLLLVALASRFLPGKANPVPAVAAPVIVEKGYSLTWPC